MKITDFKSLNMLKPVLCYVSLYILYLMFQFVAVCSVDVSLYFSLYLYVSSSLQYVVLVNMV